jgi:hypothetical protein
MSDATTLVVPIRIDALVVVFDVTNKEGAAT